MSASGPSRALRRCLPGFGDGLVGRLLMIDALSMRFETLHYKRDPQNPLNGDAAGITDLGGHRWGAYYPVCAKKRM